MVEGAPLVPRESLNGWSEKAGLLAQSPLDAACLGSPTTPRNGDRPCSSTNTAPALTLGLDLGDRRSNWCLIGAGGEVLEEDQVPTTKESLTSLFDRLESCRVVIEACGHVHWTARLIEGHGHEVIVANPRELRLISKSGRKNDRNDTRTLARLGRVDPELLRNDVGLAPRLHDSGAKTPELRISKCGDRHLRRLLVNAASYILGPFGGHSELRRYGERIARNGSQRDKARARIAVARKLACLLHHLWRTGSAWDPNYAPAR